MKISTTNTINILSDCENFELFKLLNDQGKVEGDLYLIIFPTIKDKSVIWDNGTWVLKLLSELSKREKTSRTKELKYFCKENKLDFKESKRTLRGMYKVAKNLKMIKNNLR